jgi:hypothetical protein
MNISTAANLQDKHNKLALIDRKNDTEVINTLSERA